MARTTLARLVQEVRGLCFAGSAEYTLGTASYWDDDQVEIVLDHRRADVWRRQLQPILQYSGGTPTWKVYDAGRSEWEATAGGTAFFVVEDVVGNVSAGSGYSADYGRGLVTFTADQHGSARYVTGRVYDVFGASADLLRAWANRWSRQFDFSVNQESYKRSQSVQMLRDLADEYELKAWPTFAVLVRSDVAADGEQKQDGYTGGAAHGARSS